MENEKPSRILLAEDQELLAKVMRALLARTGMTADVAENGKVAAKMMTKTRYELVITDLMMPVMDGVQLVEWIRNTAALHVPIIILSANVDEQHNDRLRELGVQSILKKPLDMAHFAQEVKAILDVNA